MLIFRVYSYQIDNILQGAGNLVLFNVMKKELPKSYDAAEREAVWGKFWEEENIYRFDEKSDKPIFSVDTPPPYVSAEHLHVGHIMSYSQAEFVVRFKRMRGFNVFYPMGFDDNGLPTERFVEKKYKINKGKITRSEFVKKCLEETKIGAQNYKHLWTLMGISVDWSKTYSTINKHSQKISQWSFIDLYKKGLIYRTKKPALWCTACQTAISQADLEAEEKESNLVYIRAKAETGEDIVFATTRPELLPACMGISVHPDDKRYERLIGKKIKMPITGAEVILTTDEASDMNFGSGAVYYCSYGGGECIEWLSRHPEAKPIELILSNGRFSKRGGKYEGQKTLEARKNIIEDLGKEGALVKLEPMTHTVYVHERCQTDVEYVEAEQWFIKLLDNKEEFLQRGRELRWFPPRMGQIYDDWIKGLKWDWCISRQRYYGVPFPVWYCGDCGEIIMPDEKNLPVDPTEDKPPLDACPKCQSKKITGEKDVMDTWMTSSLTPLIGANLVEDEATRKKLYPATLRPQAFEIIRTWLFYTIAKSHYHHNILPFRDTMISGHGLDQKGKKISKRLGNYVEPTKIIEQYGADALRYWATGATLGENLRYNEDEVRKGKKTANKIFNAAKFTHQFLKDDHLGAGHLSENLEPADKWVLSELSETIKKTAGYFEKYEYSKARNAVDEFFWHIFTDNYLEFVKYRLYDENPENGNSALAARQTLHECLLSIIKMYAPIMPYIAEEIYQAMFRDFEKDKSVHLSEWPDEKRYQFAADKTLKTDFAEVLKIVEKIRKFKSANNLSLGKELDEFKCEGSENLQKYKNLIEKALRVRNLLIIEK